MRAFALGVVIEAGPGSKFKVGDYVSGSWGELLHQPTRFSITKLEPW